jgi:hypothetical protein
MLRRFCILIAASNALAHVALAQQVVAPTPDPVGSPRGENRGDYNYTQSFETGYRFSLIGGDLGEYRSDVNYGNGIRLLGSSLTVNSKDGHGHLFDEIVLNTSGLGNDPYQSVMLRVQKNKLYRYDMTWRLSDYFNPGLTVAGGTHFMNTSRRIQDHDVTLLPQSKIQFHLGYSRNTESGPALSTAQEFDQNGSGLPIFTDVRRSWNEYRLGAEANVSGFKLTVMRRWDFYKDDTPATSDGVVAAGTATDQTVVQQFNRSQPIHGSNNGWLGNLFTRRKHWGVNARLTYVDGQNDFALIEAASGLSQFGQAATRQILVGGNASRPDLAGDFAVSLFPTDNLTLVNNTSISNNRIDGLSSYTEYFTGFNLGTTIYFRYLAIRTITNSSDLNYRASKWLGFYGGYHYSDRQVRTIEALSLPAFGGAGTNNSYSVTNQLQSGLAGIRVRPIKPLTINLDAEIGRNTEPLTPIANGKYHTLGGRVEYRTRKVQLSTAYRELYNNNVQQAFSLFSSHSRTYSASASWSPQSWLSFDASYVKLHLDTQSFLAFFAGVIRPQLQTTDPSLYISNIHTANLGVRIAVGKRADVYAGYSIVKDVGDGRATAIDPAVASDPVKALLSSVQTFPLTYESPLARVSVRISPKVRWNAGWQYYGYGEQFGILSYYQNFHAHTGYTSVLWSF